MFLASSIGKMPFMEAGMGKHDWIIACLIEMVEYSEREGLGEVGRTLNRSISRIAPSLRDAARSTDRLEAVVIPFRKAAVGDKLGVRD